MLESFSCFRIGTELWYGLRSFHVRRPTWSFLCARAYIYLQAKIRKFKWSKPRHEVHSRSYLRKVYIIYIYIYIWLGKTLTTFPCAPDGVRTSGLRMLSPTRLYQLIHLVTRACQLSPKLPTRFQSDLRGPYRRLNPHCDHNDLADSNPIFSLDTPGHDDAPSYPSLVAFSWVVRSKIYLPDKTMRNTDGSIPRWIIMKKISFNRSFFLVQIVPLVGLMLLSVVAFCGNIL